MYCTKCGQELTDDERFCPNCGTAVGAHAEEAAGDAAFEPKTPDPATRMPKTVELPVIGPEAQPQAAQPTVGGAAQPVQAGAATQGQPGGKKGLGTGAKVAIVVAVVAVVAVLAIVIATFVLQQNRTVQVSFETDGGTTVAAEQVKPGTYINSPTDPEKNGYRFDDWYSDAHFSQKVDFPYKVPDYDVTIFAKWTKMSDGDTGGHAGQTSITYPSTDSTNSALKAYFSDMKAMSDRIATAAQHFNASFKKGPNARTAVEEELSGLSDDIYEKLADGYETSWKVTSMDVPESMASVRDKMGTASDRLLDRINCMQQALYTIDGMYDPTPGQIDEAISGYMQQSSSAYKEYKKLERSIANDLG